MEVLALIEGIDHVCYRYRIEAFAWALAERGALLRSTPLRKGTRHRIGQLHAVRQVDVVILQRKLLPIWQLTLLRRSARRLVYDLDDAVFQRDSYHRKGPTSTVRTARFWATVYAADAIIAGNDFLREAAAAYVEPDRVHVIPTCLEPSWYRPTDHRHVGFDGRNRGARLAWIGQRSTLPSLQRAREHLVAAARRVPGLQLRLICDRAIELPPLRIALRPWSSSTEASELADCDIGIHWLPDDSWSRGKCGLKVLQYMAAGLPVVANPVGINRELVVDGQTGLLASTPHEWAKAIARLAADPALRERLGSAGRRMVEQGYSVARWATRFADVVTGDRHSAGTQSASIPRAETDLTPRRYGAE
jgi:glycosyltransferase involved in cell wall biosynthesis